MRSVTLGKRRHKIYCERESQNRATLRGDSTHTRVRVEAVTAALRDGHGTLTEGKEALVRTRNSVELGWRAVSDMLMKEERTELAATVRQFVDRMPPVRTDKERLASELLRRAPATRSPQYSPNR